jgi:anti-sigma B factor antagonist
MADERLNLNVEERDGIQMIHVSGSWDALTHEPIRCLLESWMGQPGIRIVLDCEGLSYINSTGLLLLARSQRLTSQNGAFLGVAALNRRITRAIAMLGMDKKINLYATVEEAMAAAAG